MNWKDLIKNARRSIKSNRLRSNLTIIIIVCGIVAIIGIITSIKVLESSLVNNFTEMGSNTFTIQPYYFTMDGQQRKKRRKQSSWDKSINYNEAKLFKENYTYPAVVSLSIMAHATALIKTDLKKSNPNISVMGIDENYLSLSKTALSAGRNFTATEIQAGENRCLIGNKLAKDYFGSANKAVDEYLKIGDARYRVLGVLESVGSSMVNRTDNQVFVSYQNARSHFNVKNKSFYIHVRVNDLKYMNMAMGEAQGIMRSIKKVPIGEEAGFSIENNESISKLLIENTKYISIAGVLIGFITLLGAAIALMNIMLVAVAERTREIGISKAIGASNVVIKRQFLFEAIYISLLGGIIGIVIGILMGNLLSLFLSAPFIIPWNWVAIAVMTCFAVGLGAGIYPAIKASKLHPIDALRYE